MVARPEAQLFIKAMMGILMFGVGAGLTPAAFGRLLAARRPVAVGMACQLVLLPLLALLLASRLPQPLAIGLVLLAACPGGVISNLVSVIARADTALSVTLTTLSTALSVLTVPLWLGIAWACFGGQPASLSLADSALQTAGLTVVPVSLGMAFRHRWPSPAQRMQRPFRRGMLMLIGLMAASVIGANKGSLAARAAAVLPALLALNLGAMLAAGLAAAGARLPPPQRVTVILETGLQNAPLSLTLALGLLHSPEIALPSLIYAALMMPSALLVAAGASWRARRAG